MSRAYGLRSDARNKQQDLVPAASLALQASGLAMPALHGCHLHILFSVCHAAVARPTCLRMDIAGCVSEPCRGRSIALDIAQGLFYLHKSGIVHLDIKVRSCTSMS